MTAYAQTYLFDAMQNLGDAADFAVHDIKLSLPEFWSIFASSEYARAFERGVPWAVVGTSGEELALSVCNQMNAITTSESMRLLKSLSDCNDDSTTRINFLSGLSKEYWCGYSLAYLQWKTSTSFSEINTSLPIETVACMYRTYHEQSEDKFVEAAYKMMQTNKLTRGLKFQRELVGLSQSQLAKKSGVGIRAIQQYEQGAKDIKRASYETVIKLSRALFCKPEDLADNLSRFEYAVVGLNQ